MDVRFEEEQRTYVPRHAQQSATGLTGLVIRWGLAKDEAGASQVLIIAAVLLIVIAVAVPFLFGSGPERIPQSVIDANMQRAPTR